MSKFTSPIFGHNISNEKLFQILLAGFRKLLFDPGENFCNACVDSRKIFMTTGGGIVSQRATPWYNTNQRFASPIIVCQRS